MKVLPHSSVFLTLIEILPQSFPFEEKEEQETEQITTNKVIDATF